MKLLHEEKKSLAILGISFVLFSFITATAVSPITKTNAEEQSASQTVGPNTISMSNDNSVNIAITPTPEQTIYTGTNTLSVTNSCPSGATITITTNSDSSTSLANKLIHSGLDNQTRAIDPTTGSTLIDNSWGYSINDGVNYYAVPTKDGTPATIYNSSSATSDTETVNVKYGIKMNHDLPSGSYSNDVVYTVAVKPACLSYTLKWDLDGGTGKPGADYSDTQNAYGSNINLTNYTPTKEGHTFKGWSNGSSTFVGNETSVNINEGNARTITLKAQWEEDIPETLYIYQNGDQKTSITGGWAFRNLSGGVNNGNAISPTMYMNVTGTAGVIGHTQYQTNNSIDVSNYSKAVIVVTEHAISNPNSGECSSSITTGISSVDGWKITGTGTLVHTIAKNGDQNSGPFYVVALGNCYGTSRIRISSIYLQK